MGFIFWITVVVVGWALLSFFSRKKKRSSVTHTASTNLAKRGIGKRRKSRKYLTPEKPDIDLSSEKKYLLEHLENTKKNIFLTGRAGTGKSTLLKYFQATTGKNTVVLAPTGVAAVNVQGQTIHSFFKFPPGITEDKVYKRRDTKADIYKRLDTIVIDEVSMVRADLFDCIDKFLRLNGPDKNKPFGGIQMILIGDLYQLPPVVPEDERSIFESYYLSPFFFDAKSYDGAGFKMTELTEVYRQSDVSFIEILDAIRTDLVTDEQLISLNESCISDTPESKDFNLALVPTNRMADNINLTNLDSLPGDSKTYIGIVSGDFKERNLPTSEKLTLKEGAQIMLLNNDPKGRWINGDVARVIKLNESSARVLFDDQSFDDITYHTWEMIRFVYDEEEGKIVSEIIGSFSQLPVRLAWAVTIHKGQGKTFDKVEVDFGNGTFAPGQAYVALSRCRSLEGLFLKSPVIREHIFIDPRIQRFMENTDKLELPTVAES